MVCMSFLLAMFLLTSTFWYSDATKPLEPVGKLIQLGFPNDKNILGVGGLAYDEQNDVWTVSAENLEIPSSSSSTNKNDEGSLSTPRMYKLRLNFEEGSLDFINSASDLNPIPISSSSDLSSDGLKIEDLDAVPPPLEEGVPYKWWDTPTVSPMKQVWLASEANSKVVKTKTFLSKDFGPTDLTSFDPKSYTDSRIIRVDSDTGNILEEAAVPDYILWDTSYDWDYTKCVGNRPFSGFHALSIVSRSDEKNSIESTDTDETTFDHFMFVALQSALYQDGTSPTYFQGSATRILVYGLEPKTDAYSSSATTSHFLKSYRYDTSHLTINSFQKGASHFNGLFGILAIDETAMLVVECEDLHGFGLTGRKVINRIFYVQFDPSNTIDHCTSLLDCNGVDAPTKRLLWEREDKMQLDGIARGPPMKDPTNETLTYQTVALSFEDDEKIGVHFELFILRTDELQNVPIWDSKSESDVALLKKNRYGVFSICIGVLALIVLIQLLIQRNYQSRKEYATTIAATASMTKRNAKEQEIENDSTSSWNRYALFSAMLNSFLVGGVTFGFGGVLLILRKEGTFAGSCACGSFCSTEKEALALISTVGFAVAIGSRLFIGYILDKQGPKTTALLCGNICLSGFVVIASTAVNSLSNSFLAAWVLLSFGGSGLHLTGFHFTNLFHGDDKKIASACISAAFGASSAIFPIMQVFSQYMDVSFRLMAAIYSVVVLLVILNNFLIQPWNKVQAGIAYKPNFRFWSRQWWQRDVKKKPMLASVWKEVVKFEFWGETLFYSVSLLLLTHFLSTCAQLLYEKGDKPFTSSPNDWTDYMYTRLQAWLNSFGFVWFPTVQALIHLRWSTNYLILCIINILIIGAIMIQYLEAQIFVFVLSSLTRLMLFSFHHAYILDVFGIEFFGTLNGISSMIAAIIGLLSYPLQLFSLSTNYAISFLLIGCGIIVSIQFPLKLRRLPVMNWAESFGIDQSKMVYPKDITELLALVKKHSKIRVAGALHSCAPLIESEGIIISLEKFDQILNINTETKIVRVQAGVKIHDLCEELAAYDLALGTLGSIDWQTVAGAVMTGTHGGSLTIPSLHSFVKSYTVVKANGDLCTISSKAEPTLFSAMAPSMGLLGIVVEMEIEVVPLDYLEARMTVMDFNDLSSQFEDIMQSNKYARCVVYPSISKVTVWTANPVKFKGEAVAGRGALETTGYINFRDETEKAWLEQSLYLNSKGLHDEADKLLHKVLESQLKRLKHYEGRYNHVLCKERNNGIPHADIEFNFDFKINKDILNSVKSFCDSNRVPYYNFEIRTTQQDDAMLSCCQERDAMWIDFQAKYKDSTKFFPKIEAHLKSFGFRKHWAKGLGQTKPDQILEQFPRINKFIKIMDQMDPDGKFQNKQATEWFEKMSFMIGV